MPTYYKLKKELQEERRIMNGGATNFNTEIEKNNLINNVFTNNKLKLIFKDIINKKCSFQTFIKDTQDYPELLKKKIIFDNEIPFYVLNKRTKIPLFKFKFVKTSIV